MLQAKLSRHMGSGALRCCRTRPSAQVLQVCAEVKVQPSFPSKYNCLGSAFISAHQSLRLGCDLVHFDVFIKYLALCLQPVAKMHFVQLSLMLNLKCVDKKQGGAGGWNKGWVSNCEVLGPVVMSPQAISTFSTHFLKKWLQGCSFPGHVIGKTKQKKNSYLNCALPLF